jgi:hypothetical protein
MRSSDLYFNGKNQVDFLPASELMIFFCQPASSQNSGVPTFFAVAKQDLLIRPYAHFGGCTENKLLILVTFTSKLVVISFDANF